MADDPTAEATSDGPTAEEVPDGSTRAARTATVRTTHDDAETVAAALAPDETDAMHTRVDGDVVACTVDRPTTAGVRSTVDDYVVNLRVADRVTARARDHLGTAASRSDSTDAPQTTTHEPDTTSDT